MSQWTKSRRGYTKPSSSSGNTQDLTADACLRVVDFSLGAVIFLGPHLFGGRHMLGRFVILTLCVVAAAAWFMRQCLARQTHWNHTGGLFIFIAALVLVALQITPLPAQWIEYLAPRIGDILPLWTADSQSIVRFGQWKTLSLAPEETRLALATLLGYGLLFVTAAQRLESIDDIKRLVRWIASSAIIVALFGIVQYFTSNGKFFWFYDYPYTDTIGEIKAGFTSRNHFAHFLVLGLACLLTWATLGHHQEKSRHKKRGRHQGSMAMSVPRNRPIESAGLSMAIAVVVFAILASLSRGGLLAMIGSVVMIAICYSRVRILGSKHVLAGGTLLLAMILAMTVSGNYEEVTERLRSLTSQSMEELDSFGGRRLVWSANMAASRAGWLTGSGAGSHRFIYPLYIEKSITKEYTHAENGYLQVATENGLPGILLLLATLLACSFWCLRAMHNARENVPNQVLTGGVAAALFASAVHSMVDFVWFIPACATVTVLLAACAMRLAHLTSPRRTRSTAIPINSTITKFNLALGSSLAGIWAVLTLFPSAESSLEWDRYLLADKANQLTTGRQAASAQQSELVDMEQLNTESSLLHLSNVVRGNPHSARAHVRLAGALLHRFEFLQRQSENAMSISQIREAAQSSSFPSGKQLREWLLTAFGDNCRLLYQAHLHARRAIELCPLQGEGYLYLSELCFLEGRSAAAVEAYCHQSLLVRPQDPDVLFSVGKNQLIAGNTNAALKLWSQAYRGAGKHRNLIIQILAGRMAAANFIQVFQPDWSSLEALWNAYRESATPDDLQSILSHATEVANRQTLTLPAYTAGMIWLGLSRMHGDMAQPKAALQSLQRAYAASPDAFPVRYELGSRLMEMQQFELAEPHLRWCYSQRPDNVNIQAQLMQISRIRMQKLASVTRATAR